MVSRMGDILSDITELDCGVYGSNFAVIDCAFRPFEDDKLRSCETHTYI